MPGRKIKVLLVDDDDLIKMYFRDVFWIHGGEKKYEIETAAGPEEAEKIIQDKKTRPDIVFLDLVMPSKKERMELTWQTGLELLKKIKTSQDLKNIKVVVYSGLTDKFVKEEVKKYGIELYITKGDNLPKEIIEITEKIIAK